MSYDSNQPIPELCELQLSSWTQPPNHAMFAISNPPNVFILLIPLTFRPPNGRGTPFLRVAN